MVFNFLKVCFATLLVSACVSHAQAENWTSLDGSRTVVGSLVGIWDNHAVLVLEEGRRVSVPLSGLNAVSRIQAEKLSVQIAAQRASLNKELSLRAKMEAAPAPDPLPTPPAPPIATKIGDTDDAATTLNTVASELRAGHISVLWDALPSSYQSDLETLVRLSSKKLDPLRTEAPLASLYNLADLIVTRQNWIASHPKMIADVNDDGPNEKLSFFREIVLPIASSIRAGLPPDATSLESWQAVNLEQWIQQRDQDMAPFLAPLLTQIADNPPLWELVESEDKTATVKKSGIGTASPAGYPSAGASGGLTIKMSRVENRWVPADMATGWPDWVKKQTETLEQAQPGSLSISDLLGASSTTTTASPAPAPSGPSYGSEYSGSDDLGSDDSGYDGSDSGYSGSSSPGPGYSGSGSGSGYSASGYSATAGSSQNLLITMLPSLERLPMLDPTVNLLKSPTEASTFHQAIDQSLSAFSMIQDLMQTFAPPRRAF